MALREELWPRDSQPQEPVGLNPAIGLRPLVIFNGVAPYVDLASGQAITRSAGAFLRTQRGGLAAANAGLSYFSIASQRSNDAVLGATFFALFISQAASTECSVLSKTTGVGAVDTPFDFGIIGSAPMLALANAGGFRAWGGGTARLTDGKLHAIAARTNGTDISVEPSFWVDGLKDTAAATNHYGGTGTGSATTNANPVSILNRDDLSSPWSVTAPSGVLGAIALAGQMTDAAIAYYTRSPETFWQLLAPQLMAMPRLVASSFPTLSAALLVNLATTTATPRVTITF